VKEGDRGTKAEEIGMKQRVTLQKTLIYQVHPSLCDCNALSDILEPIV
jgi:hypothetical protein